MHAYSKSLVSVTARSSRISDFTKIGMAMPIPAIPLLPALDIQGYGVHIYISACLWKNIDIGSLAILQPCVNIPLGSFHTKIAVGMIV